MIINCGTIGNKLVKEIKGPVSILKNSCQNQRPSEQTLKNKKKVGFEIVQQSYSYFSYQSNNPSKVNKKVNNSERPTLSNISNSSVLKSKNLKEKSQNQFFVKNNLKTNNQISKIQNQQFLLDSYQTFKNKFKQIFINLDNKKIGYINKDNCWTQRLTDEIKYLLGTIISSIKLNNIKLTLQQFIEHSKQMVIALSQAQRKQFLNMKISNERMSDSNNLKLSRSNIRSSKLIELKIKVVANNIHKMNKLRDCQNTTEASVPQQPLTIKTHRPRQFSK